MKKLIALFAFLAIVFASIVIYLSVRDHDPYTKKLQEVVAERQAVLSQAGFELTSDVGAAFSLPPGIENHQSRGMHAWYIPGKNQVYIHPVQKYVFLKTQWQEELKPFIDHELGHALAKHTSEKMGFKDWGEYDYTPYIFDEGADEFYGYKILSEGIGRVVERYKEEMHPKYCDFENYMPGKNFYVPQKKDDMSWSNNDMLATMLYEGGYCLAKPIIDLAGQRGVEYLIAHPLRFPDYNLRKAIRDYVSEALVELEASS